MEIRVRKFKTTFFLMFLKKGLLGQVNNPLVSDNNSLFIADNDKYYILYSLSDIRKHLEENFINCKFSVNIVSGTLTRQLVSIRIDLGDDGNTRLYLDMSLRPVSFRGSDGEEVVFLGINRKYQSWPERIRKWTVTVLKNEKAELYNILDTTKPGNLRFEKWMDYRLFKSMCKLL